MKKYVMIGFAWGCVISLILVCFTWYGYSILLPPIPTAMPVQMIREEEEVLDQAFIFEKEQQASNQNKKEGTEKKEVLSKNEKEKTQEEEVRSKEKDDREDKKEVLSKYEEYIMENTDVVGWISILDTVIDYPVYYDSSPEYFYLEHNSKKEPSKSGSICVQYNNASAAQEFAKNTLIFGHNMKDGTMFHAINNYKRKDFFGQNPYIFFDNLIEEGVWRVFSVYYIDADKETVPDLFSSDDEYLKYLEKIKKRSIYPVNIIFKPTDKIITICTCSYEYKNGRTLVHAVLVTEQEEIDALRRQ